MKEQTILIIGVGYVGEMLCDQLSKRKDVISIIALDKEPQSEWCKSFPKVTYIQHNMANDGWQGKVSKYEPTIIIHTAWQIRAMYGKKDEQWRWNVGGSNKVFDFGLSYPSVEKMIYFSTASSYSARKNNRLDQFFIEKDGFRDDDYIYAYEKKVTEENLKARYDQIKKEGRRTPQISIVRPAAITGPMGRYMRIRFGLQSALQGNLKAGIINKIVTMLTSFVPATKGWVRQFIHEDDVNDIVTKFIFEEMSWEYEVFNITPEGKPVFAKEMAEAVGKKILQVRPLFIRIIFSFFWHVTRGRIPTCPGSWRFYSYPVLMSGKKLSGIYKCAYTSRDAFKYTDGRYQNSIQQNKRLSKNG